MGCVQAKSCSPQHHPTLHQMKLQNGYVKVDSKVGRESDKKAVAVDETVGGWPRWLVENVQGDALAGFVPKSADSYDKLAKVGHGTYSNVYKARDKASGKIVALKKVRFDTSEAESVRFMAREIIILKKLDHPNIIKLEGIATSRMQYSLYLVFEFMPWDLTKLVSRRPLTEPQVKSYMQQLLSALHHCHEKGILHRDIKGSNLLINNDGVLKIADFGLANTYKNKTRLTSRVVTLWYRAPELLLGATDYGVGIDLWSAGCLLAEMFVGRPIMPGRNEIEQLHKIFKLCGSPSEEYWKTVRPRATFRPAQQYKANFEEAFPHLPRSAYGLLSTLLSLDPTSRGSADAALKSDFFTASPLPCAVSVIENKNNEEDSKMSSSRGKQQSQNRHGAHTRKVSFSGFLGVDACAKQEEMEIASVGTTTSSSNASSSDTKAPAKRAAITDAHPNALKNIKNYPLLLASLTETAGHLKESNSSLYRRSISHIDFRNLDIDKITKLLGLEPDHHN